MEYKVREFGSNNKYGDHRYWFAENKDKGILGIVTTFEIQSMGEISDIDYLKDIECIDIIDNLLEKALKHLEKKNKFCIIALDEDMPEIQEIIEKHGFETMYKPNRSKEYVGMYKKYFK